VPTINTKKLEISFKDSGPTARPRSTASPRPARAVDAGCLADRHFARGAGGVKSNSVVP